MTPRSPLRLAALLMGLLATAARAQRAGPGQQTTRCTLVPQPTTRFSTDTIAGGGQVAFVGGGVLIRCPERGITLKGDSAEQYPDRDYMIGHVVYDEPRFHLTSDYLTRFSTDERVVAVGNVKGRLPSGSTLEGPLAEFRRAVPGLRPRRQVFARQRPVITIIEQDSTGKPAPPMTVVADSVFMDGDSLIYGSGQVIINRTDIRATADSAFIDEGRETMRLWVKPELTGKKERPFRLNGNEILMFSKNRKLERVLARPQATAVSDSMTLHADTIDLRVRNDLLDHAYAWGGPNRARAESPSQTLTADSLDVLMPNQRITELHAVRKAIAEALVDTVRFTTDSGDRKDWLRGDTIVAHFDTTRRRPTTLAPDSAAAGAAAAARDSASASAPTIKQLTATGNARSYYHLAASDSAERRPAIDYLVAREITIRFSQQRVATVTAVDSVNGVYVEPRADSTARRTAAPVTQSAPRDGAPKPGTIIPAPSRPRTTTRVPPPPPLRPEQP